MCIDENYIDYYTYNENVSMSGAVGATHSMIYLLSSLFSPLSTTSSIITVVYSKYMEKYTPNLKKLAIITGTLILLIGLYMGARELMEDYFPSYVDISKVENTISGTSAALGITMSLNEFEIPTFACKKENLPTREQAKKEWQNICNNRFGTPFIGTFWRRDDFSKLKFENEVINNLLKREETLTGKKVTGNFNCKKDTNYKQSTLTDYSVITCVTKIDNSTSSIYTTFITTITVESQAQGTEFVTVVSGNNAKQVTSTVQYYLGRESGTWPIMKSASLLGIKHVYADDGGEGGGGEGDGSGSSDGTGPSGEPNGDCFSCGSGTPSVVCYNGNGVGTYGACSYQLDSAGVYGFSAPEGSSITFSPFAPSGYTGAWSFTCGADGLWHTTSQSCNAPLPPSASINFN